MDYGVLLERKNIEIKHKLLKKAGYINLPNHVDGFKVDEQWISNTTWNESLFPRFHIIRNDKCWYIHYDFFNAGEDEHRTTITMCEEIYQEIKRLKSLC